MKIILLRRFQEDIGGNENANILMTPVVRPRTNEIILRKELYLMDIKYDGYCMNFSNEELKQFLISRVEKNATVEIRILSEEGEEIDINSDVKVETIVFDGKDENLFINFYGVHTSIFVFDKEIMFIDENSKGTFTSSDVYNNVVYEGNLREMSHLEILQMFADFILCFIDSDSVEVLTTGDEAKKYKKYNYYDPRVFIITIKNRNGINQEKVFENITISLWCDERFIMGSVSQSIL